MKKHKETNRWVREAIKYNNRRNVATAVLEPRGVLDAAIMGVSIAKEKCRLQYSYKKLVEAYAAADGMGLEDAMEFVDYNTVRALPYMDSESVAGPVMRRRGGFGW